MSESTISRNSFSAFGQPPGASDKMTKEDFERASGMKFMTFSEMTSGSKPESGTGSASGGAHASGNIGGIDFSAGNRASVEF